MTATDAAARDPETGPNELSGGDKADGNDEHLLMEQEALSVDDIDDPGVSASLSVGAKRAPRKPRRPQAVVGNSGRDAEEYKLKQSKKQSVRKGPPNDLTGPIGKLSGADYLDLIMPLHVELLKMQNWVKEQGLRVLVINEGRDAAGKGGTIKRFVEHMNPRGARVVALDKPGDRERTQWYFQRYIAHITERRRDRLLRPQLVQPGNGRTGHGLLWRRRGEGIPALGTRARADADPFRRPAIQVLLLGQQGRTGTTLWQARRRPAAAVEDLSPVDQESQFKWDEYTRAKEDMFFFTSTADSPWTIIKSDDKKRARLNAIRFLLSEIDYPDRRDDLLTIDRRIVRTVQDETGVED